MKTVLVVEDERTYARLTANWLIKNGINAHYVLSINSAKEFLSREKVDLVLSDFHLPEGTSVELLEWMQDNGFRIPFLIMTGYGDIEGAVKAIKNGADDYLTKPFSVEELLARLRVTQRRLSFMSAEALSTSSVFVNGRLRVDMAGGCAYLDGQELHLTPIEYKLLCLLSKHVGKVLTHTFITQDIWGRSWENDVASLRVFMATLRKKLEAGEGSPQYIQTHIGVGYRMLRVEEAKKEP